MKYQDAGVDIDAAAAALARVKRRIRATFGPEVIRDVGLFGGCYALPGAEDRVLVASADGVGTKVLLHARMRWHERVGEDLVAHCVNDIAVLGARPLFFLDYVAGGSLTPDLLEPLIGGFADACSRHGVALLGGETAEMPGLYGAGNYDVAGFIVGIASRDGLIDGAAVRPGDAVLGFPSTGLHTNGYSLARKVLLEEAGLLLDDEVEELGETLADALLRTHRSYRGVIENLIAAGLARGLAHITGGGLPDNIPRILPEGCGALLRRDAWDVPPLFRLIERLGRVEREEMDRVFNMGIGLAAVVPGDRAGEAVEASGEGTAGKVIGRIVEGERRVLFE